MLVRVGPDEVDGQVRSLSEGDGRAAGMRSTRILVVEDERHIARLLEYVLTKAGYELRICHSGEEALAEMAKSKPDAVVLDLVLPGMPGLEVLRLMRLAPYYCTGVVIILSSHWFEETNQALMEAGASAQCSKPIAPSSLVRKLQQLGVHPLTEAND